MKRAVCTSLFLVLSLFCFSQWTNIPNNFQNLNANIEQGDIIMTNNGVGFQKLTLPSQNPNNNSVYIYRTIDDWLTATVISVADSNSTCCSEKIEFINDSTGIRVLTNNGLDSIFKTNNGGSSWNYWFTSNNISNVQLLNDTTLFFAKKNSTNLVTVNRIVNQNQTVIYTANNPSTFLSGNGIYFLDQTNGYILSVDPTQTVAPNILKKTTNAGLTWYNIFPQSSTQASFLKFKNSTTGYFGNNHGHVYKTTDSGITWRLIQTPLSANVNDIEFGANNSVYISSLNGMLIKSTNDGLSWVTEQVGTNKNLIDIHTMDNSNTVYVVASDGELFKNDFLTSIPTTPKNNNVISTYPNPTSNLINIKSSAPLVLSTLFNVNGKVVFKSTESSIDVSHLSSGLYFLRVETISSQATLKLIKE